MDYYYYYKNNKLLVSEVDRINAISFMNLDKEDYLK